MSATRLQCIVVVDVRGIEFHGTGTVLVALSALFAAGLDTLSDSTSTVHTSSQSRVAYLAFASVGCRDSRQKQGNQF